MINEYEPGDSIGKHSDDERDLAITDAGIVAISMGASRTFRVKAKMSMQVKRGDSLCAFEEGEVVDDLRTRSGQYLQMAGRDFQSCFTHQVPSLVRDNATRWSLTFREYR